MFVCTVSHEHTMFDLIREGSALFVLVPIGYDDDADRDVSYYASVGVDVAGGGGTEMFFAIIEADHETGADYRYWSGRDTSSFILGRDRDRVLDAICLSAQLLIDSGLPDELDVTTYDEHPPNKAVIKHFAVMSVFERNGYEIQTADPYHGRRHWRMVRSNG